VDQADRQVDHCPGSRRGLTEHGSRNDDSGAGHYGLSDHDSCADHAAADDASADDASAIDDRYSSLG
jgi:hypothetical protein